MLVLFLIVAAGLVYLDQAGLPDFLKQRLLAELRTRGLMLEFGRLHFRWHRGIVAEGVTVGGRRTEGGELTARELVVRADPAALVHRALRVKSIELVNGHFVLPLISTNEPPQRLALERIHAELRFLPEDCWSLDHFTANCLGTSVHLSGFLTNASALPEELELRPATRPSSIAPWHSFVRRCMHEARRMKFSRPPEIHVDFRGDARNLIASTVDLRLSARGTETVWGTSDRLLLLAHLNRPSGTNGLGRSELRFEARETRTPWSETSLARLELFWVQSLTQAVPAAVDGEIELQGNYTPWGETPLLRLAISGRQTPHNPALLYSELRLTSGDLVTGPGRARTNQLSAQLYHDAESLIPRRGQWQLRVTEPEFERGNARDLRASGRMERKPPGSEALATADWAWWAWLEPLQLEACVEIDGLQLTNVLFENLLLDAEWKAPQLRLRQLHGEFEGRPFDASGQIDIPTRRFEGDACVACDVKKLQPLLSPSKAAWLENYGWQTPPLAQAHIWATLPAWTNAHPDLKTDVAPSLGLAGSVDAVHGSFKGLSMDTARFDFRFTNRIWHLTDFVATAPEGRLEFEYREDQRTKDYVFHLHSQLDPHALKPLVPETQHRAFDLFRFREPPDVAGEVRGRWRSPERTGVAARLRARDFSFRDEPVRAFEAQLTFTNGFLSAANVQLEAENQETVTADGVGLDIAQGWLQLTNAVARIQPNRVTRAIGEKVARTLEPYSFHQPVTARVQGGLNVRNTHQADLRFDVAGGPFSWWRFQVPEIRGLVHWHDDTLSITNLEARFYQGDLSGRLFFDFTAGRGADFQLQTHVFNANLHQLMADLWTPTNQLEGTVAGDLVVTRANTDDWSSWQGYGRAELYEGFLWDIPLLGIFSDAFEGIGIGKSRISGLTATYGITNSVIHTTDLALRSAAMRLAYRGTFDFEGRANGRAEAQLLRDAALIGPLVSAIFFPLTKLFEYRITGTLTKPVKEPLYIPKPLLIPLNPFGTLRQIFVPEKPPAPAAPERQP